MKFPDKDPVEWAIEANEKNCLILDTETTGFSKTDEVIDLGIVRAGSGEIVYDRLFKPQVAVNPKALQVHSISDSLLRTAPKITQHWEEIAEILDNRYVIAYNCSFDERLLIQTLKRYNLPVPRIHFVCAMKKYRIYSNSNQTSLTKACEEMVVAPGTHRAVTDALATARLIYRMSKRYSLK